ncbi:MAG: hypothetical protein Q8M31_21585 [Beijerinckiaceae bacterium]|nr:hypothetical protein [Beijerinckiaceae bacterium]
MAITYTLISDPSNQFDIVGNNLRVASALVVGVYPIVVRAADYDEGWSLDLTTNIEVVEASEGDGDILTIVAIF